MSKEAPEKECKHDWVSLLVMTNPPSNPQRCIKCQLEKGWSKETPEEDREKERQKYAQYEVIDLDKPKTYTKQDKKDEHNQDLTASYLTGYQRGKDDTKQEVVDVLNRSISEWNVLNCWFRDDEDELDVVDVIEDIAEKLGISVEELNRE